MAGFDLDAIDEIARSTFDARFLAREKGLELSRRVIRASANAIRSLHRGEIEKAERLMDEAGSLLREATDALVDHPDVLHAGFLADAAKEYAEARLTHAFGSGLPIPTPADLGVDVGPYLKGLGETVGELRRRLLDLLRAGKRDEGEATLYQFDRSDFSKTTNDAGKTVYVVQPQPPAEELESIPAGSPSFVADGQTYYYVDFNLYVAYAENGDTGFINGEPDLGAQVDKLPEGSTEIEYEGKTYHQFDMVFFEQVRDEAGAAFYEVVDAPGGDEVTVLESN
jgi:translin